MSAATTDISGSLCVIFDRWRQNDMGSVLVSHIETLVSQHLGLGPQLCIYGELCGKGVAVEHDGSVYACDHYPSTPSANLIRAEPYSITPSILPNQNKQRKS